MRAVSLMWTLINTDGRSEVHQSPIPAMGNSTARSRGESEGDAASLCGIRLADADYWCGLVTQDGVPIVAIPTPVCEECQAAITKGANDGG